MKEQLLFLIENFLTIYFYFLILRLFLNYAKDEIKEHILSEWIIKITDFTLRPLEKAIPNKKIGEVPIYIALILHIVFYKLFLTFVLYALNLILI